MAPPRKPDLVAGARVPLDATNLRILQLLSNNGRASVADLAAAVGRSESAVRDRLAHLENRGILRGYTARLDLNRLGFEVRGQVRARCDLRRLDDIVRRLQAVPEVLELRLTTGQRPILIEVCAPDMAGFERLLATRIAPLELEALEVEVTLQSLIEARHPEIGVREKPPVALPLERLERPATAAPVSLAS